MKDFVQQRLELERAWADTEPMGIADIGEPNFYPDVNDSPLDDLYSDVVSFCVLVYIWFCLYVIFR